MKQQQSRVHLTAGRVADFTCPLNKAQAFLWDTETPTLALRATPTGRKTYIFESRLNGSTVRINIGTLAATLKQARTKATDLAVMVNAGTDPREVERDKLAANAEKQATAAATAQAAKVAALTVGEVWTVYLAERKPHWGALHYRDHIDKANPGGLPSRRRGAGKQLTKPGPLAALMPLALRDLDQPTIEAWAAKEGKTRPTSARLAWRLLTVFLTWCGEQPEYAALLPHRNPAKTKKARESLGKAGAKYDVLQKGQLSAWFTAVQKIQNPTISAFLQVLLLTGARLNEVQTMRWDDVNTQWKGLSINDKMDGSREVPLTPYVEKLITALPRRNGYVFASARALSMSRQNIERRQAKAAKRGKSAPVGEVMETSQTGYISEPNTPHTRACRTVGIEGLTLHGLRRSFASLCEWLDIPGGVSAQIQGHAPQGVREQNYIRRPLDLLRVHHEKIEAWILEQAGIVFDAKAAPGALHLVVT